MSDFSNYSENQISDWVMGKASVAAATTRYLALFTAVSDAEAGTGTEVSGGGYARVAITSLMGTSSGGAITNSSNIEFAVATGSWGTVTHCGVFDASSGGNAITVIKALASSVAITTDDVFRILAGELDFATT